MILDGNLVPPPVASGAFIAQAFTGNECDSVTCQVRKKNKKFKKHNFFKENATCVTDEFDIGGYHCECDSGFVEEDGICKES